MAFSTLLLFLLLLANAVLIHGQTERKSSRHLRQMQSTVRRRLLQGWRALPTIQLLPAGPRSHKGAHDNQSFSAGGGKSKCDDKYHSNNEKTVTLSTGWYDKGKRCGKTIKINANNKSVLARIVDECDSFNGCDKEHGFQPPCHWNTVDASPAVWKALENPKLQIGDYTVTWSDA